MPPLSHGLRALAIAHLLFAVVVHGYVVSPDSPHFIAHRHFRQKPPNCSRHRPSRRLCRPPTQQRAFLPRVHHRAAAEFRTAATADNADSAVSGASTADRRRQRDHNIVHESRFLGPIYRVKDDDEEEDSFLAKSTVPTFAACSADNGDDRSATAVKKKIRYRSLDGALYSTSGNENNDDDESDSYYHGPAAVLDNVLSAAECDDIIETCEHFLGFGQFDAGKNRHGAMQIMVPSHICDDVARRLASYLPIRQVQEFAASSGSIGQDDSLVFSGLNRRWRVYRYGNEGTERFAPHIDASFPPSGLSADGTKLLWDCTEDSSSNSSNNNRIVSRLTILFYLNDDFVGGETNFYQPLSSMNGDHQKQQPEPGVIASVRPVTGSCLIFPQGIGAKQVEHARQHWPLHEGSPVVSGKRPKYVIRSDVLFATVSQQLQDQSLSDDPLFQYDHLVRRSFLPNSPVFHSTFLGHIESLYNPHMGVENMGPFLYSFLRLVKKRRVVEIGAGYTSLWILQALKDNEDEMERIRTLQRDGHCRLLDWPWTVPSIIESYDEERAMLLCIDNCEHQKETATGASAVAQSLGLSEYMKFLRSDAFDTPLEKDSTDVLWCDFGVGSKMRKFVASTWPSLRPGGFLLCHSTLTNRRTRDWLEAARQHLGENITGLPPDEYVELSLLEPHKHYQNSISIFQKRTKGYQEPVYSEYA